MKELDRMGGPHPARRYGRKGRGGKRYAPLGNGRGRKPRRRRVVLQRPHRLLGLLALVCVAVGVVVALDYFLTGEGEIQRGVEAGGISLSGMTENEARDAIAGQADAAFREIELASGGDSFALPGKDIGVGVDAAAAAREAYAVGRTGGPFQRLSDVLGSYLGGGVEISAEAAYNREAARGAMQRLSEDFDRDPKDAGFVVNDGGEVVVEESVTGRAMDVDATLANLDATLGAGLQAEVRSVPLVADEKEPGMSTEEATALKPDEIIGEYKTDYAWDPDKARRANLKMASAAVDNTLLAPGEVFSFAGQAGDLDYGAAKVFADGGVAKEVGGGLCQVSSTLYMAANYAGLEIVERSPHYAELPYINPGFDATVWFGDWQPMDMRFKNTTDGYVLVREFVDKNDFLTAQIYAQKPTGKRVVMNAEKVSQDTTNGIKWRTYKKVYGPNGEVLFDDMIYENVYSYNPPTPEAMKHETNDVRMSGWVDPQNTTGWSEAN